MDAQAFKTIREIHQTDWWYRARERFTLTTLQRLRKRCERNRQPWEILDVGCGYGSFSAALLSFGSVLGIDAEPDAVAFARRAYPRCRFEVGTIPAELPDASFDLITLLDVLEHLDHRVDTLQRIRERLRPKGWLLLTVPACPSLWSRRDEANHHRLRYRRQQLLRDLDSAQLRVVFLTFFNTLMLPPIWIAAQIERVLGIRPERIVQHRDRADQDLFVAPGLLNRLLYRIFLTESLVAGRIALPIGVSLLAVAERDDPNDIMTEEQP
ncbi:class I SAM-dependent methyltransferase [bacterium]|nr:class I SAM-dependent methyltransferase [bacterium]